MGFTGFFWVLLSFTGFYWVLLGFTGFYWVLPGFAWFYEVVPGFTGFYRVLPGSTKLYQVLLGFTGFVSALKREGVLIQLTGLCVSARACVCVCVCVWNEGVVDPPILADDAVAAHQKNAIESIGNGEKNRKYLATACQSGCARHRLRTLYFASGATGLFRRVLRPSFSRRILEHPARPAALRSASARTRPVGGAGVCLGDKDGRRRPLFLLGRMGTIAV